MATTITKSFNAVRFVKFDVRPMLDAAGADALDTNGKPMFSAHVYYNLIGPSGEVLQRHRDVVHTATEQLTLDTFMAAKLAAIATSEGVA